MDDADVQTVIQALFDIKTDVKTILELLLEDENGERRKKLAS